MTDVARVAPVPEDAEAVEIGELDAEEWTEYAIAQGWSDGFPLAMPTEAVVKKFVSFAHGDNEPFPPISPRQVVPTLQSLAANAVMAGCRPAYFPTVLAALRGVLAADYNLHGSLATTHPCAPVIVVSGPLRNQLGINCAGNCFGQGWRANATIGRALGLILLNIGGARPQVMDRSTQGSPAKFAFCFGENEEESPWEPYHVRRGYAASDSVVSVMSAEGPHNINDHGSNTGEDLLTTMAASIAQPGANTIYAEGPYMVVIGPEHAMTFQRDGWTIPALQQALYERARVPVANISAENRAIYEHAGHHPVDGYFTVSPSAQDIHILVAGGPGKHSAWIPSFGGTAVCSVKIRQPG